MKNGIKKPTKLNLNLQTVRTLGETELRDAAGAGISRDRQSFCGPVWAPAIC